MRMRTLTRHLIRAHLGPFLFALTAITGLIFLNAVALRIESLVGKGLSWSVVGEFLVLSLPHTVALSLPMAVLVAVLYAFSEMAVTNEMTAMAAGGVRPARVLAPLLGMGMLATVVMLFFNDTILPEANHRLKNLLVDISRKSPTFELQEGRVNEIRTENTQNEYFLTAARIDPRTNTLEDVTIFDANDPRRRRTTHATRGVMAFNQDRTDLYLTLYDGVVYEVQTDRRGGYQRLYFDRQIVPMRGVGDELDRRMEATQRGDREMDFAMLRAEARKRDMTRDSVIAESRTNAVNAVLMALGRPVPTASAGSMDMGRAEQVALSGGGRTGAPTMKSRDARVREIAVRARTLESRIFSLHEARNQYEVELYKKWAIAFACLVFTLMGPPLALRFPQGGVGMVIAASSTIFSLYWVGLIAGESLSDKGLGSPLVTMWIPNIVFTLVGLGLLRQMSQVGASARAGGWEELSYFLRSRFGRRRAAA